MSFRLDEDPEYTNILKLLGTYHKDPTGFTKYLGTSVADNTYPKQLNVIIGLIIRLHQRLDLLTNSLKLLDTKLDQLKIKSQPEVNSSKFDFENELQNISQKLSKLKIDRGKRSEKKGPQPFGQIKS